MSIRAFDWHDLPALHRYRSQCVYLHSELYLTRGPFLLPGALLSAFTPVTGIVTSVISEAGTRRSGEARRSGPIIGQAIHSRIPASLVSGAPCAHLTFLAPEENLDSGLLPPLLDHLAGQLVERGAFRLLADVEEHHPVFEGLRKSGYAIYSRQRIWKINPESKSRGTSPEGMSRGINETPSVRNGQAAWRPAGEQDVIPLRSLYNNVVPGLVQQVEPLPERPSGLVYYDTGADYVGAIHESPLLAYAEPHYGRRGIWIQPIFHPDVENPAPLLKALVEELHYHSRWDVFSRPVYVCVRSYQSWLEAALEDLGAQPGQRQAVMVRHLAIPQKVTRTIAIPNLEGGQPEISAPLAHPVGIRSENHS